MEGLVEQKFKDLVTSYLEALKENLPKDAWRAEIKKLAFSSLPTGEDFWRDTLKNFDEINFDELKAEADATEKKGQDPNFLFTQSVKKHMPGLKTQVQFDAFRASYEALQSVCNSIFEGNKTEEEFSRKLLDTTLSMCKQATHLGRKLEDVPEVATSKASNEFKRTPYEFEEYDVQQKLLEELGNITDPSGFEHWYQETKERRNSVKSDSLKNTLYDAIRARKIALST